MSRWPPARSIKQLISCGAAGGPCSNDSLRSFCTDNGLLPLGGIEQPERQRLQPKANQFGMAVLCHLLRHCRLMRLRFNLVNSPANAKAFLFFFHSFQHF